MGCELPSFIVERTFEERERNVKEKDKKHKSKTGKIEQRIKEDKIKHQAKEKKGKWKDKKQKKERNDKTNKKYRVVGGSVFFLTFSCKHHPACGIGFFETFFVKFWKVFKLNLLIR